MYNMLFLVNLCSTFREYFHRVIGNNCYVTNNFQIFLNVTYNKFVTLLINVFVTILYSSKPSDDSCYSINM